MGLTVNTGDALAVKNPAGDYDVLLVDRVTPATAHCKLKGAEHVSRSVRLADGRVIGIRDTRFAVLVTPEIETKIKRSLVSSWVYGAGSELRQLPPEHLELVYDMVQSLKAPAGAAAQKLMPAQVIDKIAEGWDGRVYDAGPSGLIDVGAAIRREATNLGIPVPLRPGA